MRKNDIKNISKEKGITLIALIITIIVLLILAGITIGALTSNNSIINQAGSAKNNTKVAKEKEIIEMSVMGAVSSNKDALLVESEFQNELTKNADSGNPEIIETNEEGYIVKFEDGEGKRYYDVPNSSEIEIIEGVTSEKTLTIQCVNSAGTVIAEKQYLILKDTYSKKPPIVDDYEVVNDENLTGTITEDTTIKVQYYLILDDDTELVFTGLNSSGNVTTVESEIVSYLVGDGVGGAGTPNGLVNSLSCKSILKIPAEYKGKTVTSIGMRAFQSAPLIVKVILPDSIQSMDWYAFGGITSITEITLPANLNTMAWAFFDNSKLKKVTFKGMSGFANGKSDRTAFQGADYFNEIEIEENSTQYKLIDDILYSYDEKTVLLAPHSKAGEVVFGESVTKVSRWCFNQCNKITSVTFGKNITSVGDRAFQYCSKLNTAIIDSPAVAKINQDNDCGWLIRNASLTTIYIKDDITTIGSKITANYTVTESDKEGYVKYVKNSS